MRRHLGGLIVLAVVVVLLSGCSTVQTRNMRATAYCNCRKCCSWTRGSWKYLKLDVWHRYVSAGPSKGRRYTGRTASGTKPRQPDAGLVSFDSVRRPWMIPIRVVFFPWLLLPQKGTIAADTAYYPFGTKMYVPGYGWGIVEDRGSAIKGPERIDLYFRGHGKARKWGVRRGEVDVVMPD